MNEQFEIQKQHREMQHKFVYYIIGISVACMGFAITRTTGQVLQWHHILLGVTLFSWAISVICGFIHVFIVLYALDENDFYFNLLQGNVVGVEQSQDLDEIAKERLQEKNKMFSIRGKLAFRGLQWSFGIATIAFIGWHIWQLIPIK